MTGINRDAEATGIAKAITAAQEVNDTVATMGTNLTRTIDKDYVYHRDTRNDHDLYMASDIKLVAATIQSNNTSAYGPTQNVTVDMRSAGGKAAITVALDTRYVQPGRDTPSFQLRDLLASSLPPNKSLDQSFGDGYTQTRFAKNGDAKEVTTKLAYSDETLKFIGVEKKKHYDFAAKLFDSVTTKELELYVDPNLNEVRGGRAIIKRQERSLFRLFGMGKPRVELDVTFGDFKAVNEGFVTGMKAHS